MGQQTTRYRKYMLAHNTHTGEINQLKSFRGKTSGARGGGTNPVVRRGLRLRGHHLQADTEGTEACGEQRL